MLVSISLIQGLESKRYLVNKTTSFVASGIRVLWPLENKKNPKHKSIYYKQVFGSDSINVYSNAMVYL